MQFLFSKIRFPPPKRNFLFDIIITIIIIINNNNHKNKYENLRFIFKLLYFF